MNTELLAAIQNNRTWLERFTRRDYPHAFREYVEQFGPAYVEAVHKTGGDETLLQALADRLLDGVEAGWKGQRVWNRAAAKANEKQMLVEYLSPMLLELEEADCPRFAKVLRDRWAARWPDNVYYTASYAKIQSGFRNMILGIEIGSRRREPEEEP